MTKHGMKNEYVYAMKPVLSILKIIGVIPTQFSAKDDENCFLESRSISLITMAANTLNIIYNTTIIFQQLNHILLPNFKVRILVAVIPGVIIRAFVMIVPFTVWRKSKELRNYWDKWKQFQNEYEIVTGQKLVSEMKTKIQFIVIAGLTLIFIAQVLAKKYFLFGVKYIWRISNFINVAIVYYVAIYWFVNYLYVRSISKKIINVVKETIQEGLNDEKLNKLTNLWFSLIELIEEFNSVHSLLFFFYFNGVVTVVIVMAFICWNYTTYSDLYNPEEAFNALFVVILYTFIICEFAYSVNKQINLKQKEILLEENNSTKNIKVTQAISFFLDTILVKNSEVNLNGFLVLSRSLFPSLMIQGMNYMIILKQFQP